MENKNAQNILIILLLFLLASCVIPSHQDKNNESRNSSNFPIVPTHENSQKGTMVLPPSSTPDIVSPTTEYTVTPFQLTKQALLYDDLLLYLKEISENNNNCQLPCIWGITQNSHIKESFLEFVNKYETSGQDHSYYYETGVTENINWLYSGVWINEKLLKADFHQKKENESEFLYLTVHSYDTEYENFWNTNTKTALTEYFSYYLLPEILQNYGEPSQIYVGVFPDEFPNPSNIIFPFGVILYYQDQNFLINYYFLKTEENNNYKACLQEISEFTAISWNSDSDPSINEIIDNSKLGNRIGREIFNAYYKSIDEVSTIDDFYLDYTGPSNMDCLIYPKDIWGYR